MNEKDELLGGGEEGQNHLTGGIDARELKDEVCILLYINLVSILSNLLQSNQSLYY